MTTINPDSEQARYRVDEKREDDGVEPEGKDAVHQRQAPHFSGNNLHIRDLTGHADNEREIGEIEIVGRVPARK